ncbi:MAG: lysophospholipid acyltransferase family protein [Spirochaetia bacterium]|jgi:1-acyl-sn-glycerol-3-phosphate acyltransferase|nr:lysophospholipid acyltransferase family protein [Spirochaetia bacterium]
MIRTIVFFSFFWTSLLLAAPLSLPFILAEGLGLKRFSRPFMGWLISLWCRVILKAAGARLSVEGVQHVPATGPVVFYPNHQGNLDILLVLATIPRQIGFLAKKQAAYLPFLNLWMLVMGCVFIDRGNISQGIQAISRGTENVRKGRAMCVFPEGTRSQGPRMLPFRNGSFRLATKAGAAIVPVTIDGAYKVWEESRRIRPASVRVVIHQPIQTAGMGHEERKALPERVRAAISGALPAG